MNCFVTGANGFIGRHLIKTLIYKGCQVHAFVRKPNDCYWLKQLDAKLIQGDLKQATSVQKGMQKVDVLFHLGAATKGKDWKNHFETTVSGTQYVLEAARKAGVGRIVYISTLGVYDLSKCKDGQWINEDYPIDTKLEKRGPYVHAKVRAEKNVFQFIETEGFPITVIRPGLVYGPGGPLFFPHIGHKIGSNLVCILGNGRNVLPFVYVENLVDAILAASTTRSAPGKVYHIVDREQITQDEYLEKLETALNWKPFKIHIPWNLLFLAAASMELCSFLDPTGKLPKTSLHLYICKSKSVRYDTTRSYQELGWNSRVSLEDGLSRTFKSYRNNYMNSQFLSDKKGKNEDKAVCRN